jgi:hypothetical protein
LVLTTRLLHHSGIGRQATRALPTGGCEFLVRHGWRSAVRVVNGIRLRPRARLLQLRCPGGVGFAQWSLLLSASLVLAPISFVLIAKPTIGLAFFLARPRRTEAAGAMVLCALAFVVQPTWVADWILAVQRYGAQGAPHIPYRVLLSFSRWANTCALLRTSAPARGSTAGSPRVRADYADALRSRPDLPNSADLLGSGDTRRMFLRTASSHLCIDAGSVDALAGDDDQRSPVRATALLAGDCRGSFGDRTSGSCPSGSSAGLRVGPPDSRITAVAETV